jgi:hypothetical protein
MKNILNRPIAVVVACAICMLCLAHGSAAQGFKFSKEQQDEAEKAKTENQKQAIAERLSTPCRAQLKNKKIVLIIGEQQAGRGISAIQQNYGPHAQAINLRLQALGLKTYTPEEIRKQIAQAEIDAYFKGDPDAALSASRRLGASFVLRGLITTQAGVNRVIPVNEVMVDLSFSLADSGGRMISTTATQGASFSGTDVRATAARLINEQADEIVARIYSDYCNIAEPPGAKRR